LREYEYTTLKYNPSSQIDTCMLVWIKHAIALYVFPMIMYSTRAGSSVARGGQRPLGGFKEASVAETECNNLKRK